MTDRLRRCAFMMALACGGCGLVLDLDPPDEERIDAGARDGGSRDAGARGDAGTAHDAGRDAGARSDAGVEEDAGVVLVDAGMTDAGPLGGPCSTSGECPLDAYCARERGVCYGSGTCQLAPTTCTTLSEPVCGCDWEMYFNPCAAAGAGVGVMQPEACPDVGVGDWCATPAEGTDPGGCGLCFDDEDCSGLLPICVASSCEAGAPGVCALGPPPIGTCYDARQCRKGERCDGAVIDTCVPGQGTCVTEAP